LIRANNANARVRNKQQIDWFRLTNIHKHRSGVITHSLRAGVLLRKAVFAFGAHDNFINKAFPPTKIKRNLQRTKVVVYLILPKFIPRKAT
jgi:hypothetical protein